MEVVVAFEKGITRLHANREEEGGGAMRRKGRVVELLVDTAEEADLNGRD